MARGFVYGPGEGARDPFTGSAAYARLKTARPAEGRNDEPAVGGTESAGMTTHRARGSRGRPAKAEDGGDSYGERLLKYIPAEVLVFFLAAAGQWGTHEAFLITTLILAIVFTPILLYAASPDGLRWYAVLLSLAAFCTWAIGTSVNTDRLIGIPVDQAPFVLTVAAFIIPAADKALGKALQRASR